MHCLRNSRQGCSILYEHIFDRIDDMVEDMKSDWKTLFLSDDYGSFLSEYAKNLIAGVYDSLRAQGAKIPEGLLESEMKKFKLNRIYDPNAELKTAKTRSTFDQFEISVNGAGSLIQAVGTVEEKHEIVTGLLVHEVSHRLFTDFRVSTNLRSAHCIHKPGRCTFMHLPDLSLIYFILFTHYFFTLNAFIPG